MNTNKNKYMLYNITINQCIRMYKPMYKHIVSKTLCLRLLINRYTDINDKRISHRGTFTYTSINPLFVIL